LSRTCGKRANAKPALAQGEDKFGPNGVETGVHKFVLRAFQREPRASAVTLGSLGPENMRYVRSNWPELVGNERPKSLPLRQFLKGLTGKINLGRMAWKEACTKSFWEHFSGNQMLLQLA